MYIEANDKKFAELIVNHGKSPLVKCVNRFVEFDGPNRLDNIINDAEYPYDFDLLSIDIDGADYFVWESITEFCPKVIIIEFNATIPNDVAFVQAKDMKINQGSSLLALVELGKKKGYELICVTSCNAIFILDKYYQIFGLQSNSISALYSPACDGRIFHGYDSYVHVIGMPGLIWSGVAVSSEDFQPLPKSLRRFGDSQSN